MRILCCLNQDLASNLALNLLLPVLERHDVRVVFTEQVGKVSADEPWQRRELRVAEQTLPNRVVFPLRDSMPAYAPAGRYLTFSQVERLRRVSMQTVQDPNSEPGISFIRAFDPDLIVSIRYGAIFKEAVLKIPRFGVLNLHSGILPAYRGVLPTFRALMNGDAEIGCTLHFINDGTIDTGDIISIARRPVVPEWSLLRHILSLYPTGVGALRNALVSLEAGIRPAGEQQRRAEGRYYAYPTREEWNQFTQAGWRVADPSDIECALSP